MPNGSEIAIVLVDASLELVPKEIAKHPAVEKTARRRGKRPLTIMLDKSLHYHAMKSLPNQEKRGRPDIVHLCLLEILESPLCAKGHIKPYIHTINGTAIRVRHDVRLPKNYNRFVGLMEQLLAFGKVPPKGDVLLEVIGKGLDVIIEDYKPTLKILLTEKGSRITPLELADKVLNERAMVMIGAFPHGEFSEEILSKADAKYSLYEDVLESFITVSVVLRALEFKLGLYDLKGDVGNV